MKTEGFNQKPDWIISNEDADRLVQEGHMKPHSCSWKEGAVQSDEPEYVSLHSTTTGSPRVIKLTPYNPNKPWHAELRAITKLKSL